MSIYNYSVKRIGNEVLYTLFRDDQEITEVELLSTDIDLLNYMFTNDAEKIIGCKLSKAHALAKSAIENMIKYEKRV